MRSGTGGGEKSGIAGGVWKGNFYVGREKKKTFKTKSPSLYYRAMSHHIQGKK